MFGDLPKVAYAERVSQLMSPESPSPFIDVAECVSVKLPNQVHGDGRGVFLSGQIEDIGIAEGGSLGYVWLQFGVS
jgi:hypothetical protein